MITSLLIATLSTPAAADPFVPVLMPDLHAGNVVLGETVLFQVDDVPAGTRVYLAGGLAQGPGPCLPNYGVCFDVRDARQLATAVADAQGVARFAVPFPENYPRDEVAFQAMSLQWGQAVLSEVRTRVVQQDPPAPVQVNPTLPPTFDPHVPTAAEVNGDTLFLTVSYGGGCAPHDFVLDWNGVLDPGFPVTARLSLWHDDHDDPCDAWLTETLRFDIKALRQGWAFGEPDTMDLIMGNQTTTYAW